MIYPTRQPNLSGADQKSSKCKTRSSEIPFKLIENYPEQKHVQTYQNGTYEWPYQDFHNVVNHSYFYKTFRGKTYTFSKSEWHQDLGLSGFQGSSRWAVSNSNVGF